MYVGFLYERSSSTSFETRKTYQITHKKLYAGSLEQKCPASFFECQFLAGYSLPTSPPPRILLGYSHFSVIVIYIPLGQVVQKAINANPGLKVKRRVVFSGIQIFFTVFCVDQLRLFKPKTDEQTI